MKKSISFIVLLVLVLITEKRSFSQVLINEVMHKPGPAVAPPNPTINQGVRRKEYVEIFNKNCFAVDISCWLIGSHVPAVVGGNYDGAFQFPNGTIIQPGQHIVIGGSQSQNNSSYPASYLTFDVNNYVLTSNLSDPNTNWLFPNGDGWVALYDNNGDVVDAVYWSFSSTPPDLNTDSDFGSKPTKPTACAISAATLASARQIKTNTPTKITYVGEATNFDMTFSRLPDGGTWTRNIAPSINPAAPTGRCNNGQCATISAITFTANTVQPTCGNNNGSLTLNVTSPGNATFVWSPNPAPAPVNTNTSTSASNLGANSYKITVTQNGCSKDTTIVLSPSSSLTPTINITASVNPICSGTSVTFNAVITNGGASPTYQWKRNGINVGTNSASFSSTALNNGDVITCVLTSNAPCVSPAIVTSNAINMVVNVQPNAGNDGSTSVCDNSTSAINLAALITGEQSGGTWTRLTGTGGTFVSATGIFTPASGTTTSTFQYSLIGTAPCSNDVSVATVNLSAQPNAGSDGGISTCDNSGAAINLATLIIGEQAGGTWTRLTGTGGTFVAVTGTFTPAPGTTTSTFQYSVAGTAPCPNDLSIATVTISSGLTASVSISASNNPICAGTSVTFSATPTNGGTPTYQWKLNGANVGTNSATYANSSLNNGDILTCVMTSNLGCVSGSPATSNQIVMVINNPVNAGSDGGISTCDNSGAAINLATLIIGEQAGGTWTRLTGTGGTFVAVTGTFTPAPGTTTSTFQYSVAGTAPCPNDLSIATVTISSGLTASVSISASNNPICAGTSVTFSATPTNGGTPTYQWKLNGANVGTNSATYANSSLNNGDILTCVMTSNLGCVSGSPATSNQIVMVINNPVNAGSDGGVLVCDNNTTIINLSNIITGEQAGGTWTRLTGTGGTFVAVTGTFTPAPGSTTSTFQYSLIGTTPCANDASVATVNINANPNAGNDGTTTVCGASTTPINLNNLITSEQTGGTWTRLTGAGGTFDAITGVFTPALGATNSTFQYNVTGVAPCANDVSIATVNFSNAQPASVIISADKNSICLGSSVTFIAVPTNGGTTPSYQWKLNGVNVGANQATYTSSSLQNGDFITCIMISSLSCVTASPATSNQIVMTVTNPVIPTIVIVADNNPICAGVTVNFSANITNGGTTPSYQWKLNGINVGTNSSTYSNTSLQNGDIITCTFTSSLGCVTSTTATSNNIVIQVTSVVVPTISISANNNPICANTPVTLTAISNGGGNNPIYQWKLNGLNVGSNSTTYSSTTFVNGDQVSCTLTSSSSCANPTSANSNVIIMNVNPIVIPTINITLDNNSVCAGTLVTATASITGGGSTPSYQWSVNGSNVGTNSATYFSSSFANGDKIKCTLTSGALCATPATLASNEITLVINSVNIPTITINGNTTSICTGQAVNFNASISNGGSTPAFQWKLNGVNIAGANSNSYSSSTLNNGDVVSCTLTSSSLCANPSVVTSSPIAIIVQPQVTPTILISTQNNPLCSGGTALFSAVITNGGSSPIYQWKVNGVTVGSNSDTYSTSTLIDNSQITCVLTSNATCATPTTIVSNIIVMDIINSNIPVNLGKDTILCEGDTLRLRVDGNYFVTWNTGNTTNSIAVTTPGLYGVLLETSGCAFGSDEIYVGFKDCSCHVEFPTAFSPNNDRVNDYFMQVSNCPGLSDYSLQIFNRWGQLVFETNNPNVGWDGVFNAIFQPVDNYIFRFSANIEGRPESGSGMFVLIR
jgi:gliding motility-associated-like protein